MRMPRNVANWVCPETGRLTAGGDPESPRRTGQRL